MNRPSTILMKIKPIAHAILIATGIAFTTQGMAATDMSKFTTTTPAYEIDDKVVLGRVENVFYSDVEALNGIAYIGKIDTGADTTSMHAENVEVYSNNPKYKELKNEELLQVIVDEFGGPSSNWWLESFDTPERDIQGVVKFEMRHPISGKVLKIERPLARPSVIRSRTSSTPIYRPVVNMPLTIAGTTVDTDVNLTDRSNFSAPILIGKTFLKENAWVFAGYDYLQEQPNAKVIGRDEVVSVKGATLDVSFSLVNNYSNMHAQNVGIDKKNNTVSFTTVGNDGKKTTLTAPLVRMLKVSGTERPMVYVPVKAGDFEQNILVYLRDRSKFSSQLRLGKTTLSELFLIDPNRENQLKKGAKSFESVTKRDNPLLVATHEAVELDGHWIDAEPSLSVKTPVLYVSKFDVADSKDGKQVTFDLPNAAKENDKSDKNDGKGITKKVVKTLNVGKLSRPVVEFETELQGKKRKVQIALQKADKGEVGYLAIGPKIARDGILINTRADELLDVRPLFTAGYIEKATVEGLTFPVKLDTGADVSSMHAINIKRFEKDGVDMVTFDYENATGQKETFTREVIDIMRIRAKAGEKPNERPVVLMDVTLGEVHKRVAVNLQDRARFEYSMILGKNFLKNGAVVSSDETYLLGK